MWLDVGLSVKPPLGWAALGLHPVPRQPIYILGVPTFAAVNVRLGLKAKLLIQRVGVGAYVQSGTLGGASLNGRGWLHVAEVHGEGTKVLQLTIGAAPNPEWGSQRPPNFKAPPSFKTPPSG